MIDALIERETLRAALALACRAPSVHNSQPWTWRVEDHSISLHADLGRWLPATDPDGRDLVVSCGAALHHLVVALAALGVRSTVHRLPNPDEPDHLASVLVSHGRGTDLEVTRSALLPRRRTDRRPFALRPVPAAALELLRQAAEERGALLRVVRTGGDRVRLLSAVRGAAATQAGTPGCATELALWSRGTAEVDGVPAANLLATPAGSWRAVDQRFAAGEIEVVGTVTDGAELVVVGTSSDDRLAQLRAGEALSAVLLAATAAGLGTCTLTQVLEVPSSRRALRDGVLDGTLEPQVVVRVGWPPPGPALPATPRRPLADVVTPG